MYGTKLIKVIYITGQNKFVTTAIRFVMFRMKMKSYLVLSTIDEMLSHLKEIEL